MENYYGNLELATETSNEMKEWIEFLELKIIENSVLITLFHSKLEVDFQALAEKKAAEQKKSLKVKFRYLFEINHSRQVKL